MEVYGAEAFKLVLKPLGCKYLYRPKYLPLKALLQGQSPHALREFESQTSCLLHMKPHICIPCEEEALSWGLLELLKEDFRTLNHLLSRHLGFNKEKFAEFFKAQMQEELPAKDDPFTDLNRRLYQDFIHRLVSRGNFLEELHKIVTHPAGPFRSLELVEEAKAKLAFYAPEDDLYLIKSPKLWLDITSEGSCERFIVTRANNRYRVIRLARRGYDRKSLEELEFYRMDIKHFKDPESLSLWLQIPSKLRPLQVATYQGYAGGFTVSSYQHVSLLNFRYSSLLPTEDIIRLYTPGPEAGRAVYNQYFDNDQQHYSFCYMQEEQLRRRAKELGLEEREENDDYRIAIARAALEKLRDLGLKASYLREPTKKIDDTRKEILELEALVCRSLKAGLYHPELAIEKALMPRILYSQEAYRPLNPFQKFKD